MNSALEVDLDFEHNVRPAPVITEEVTATIEELIQKRILEVNNNFLSSILKFVMVVHGFQRTGKLELLRYRCTKLVLKFILI